MQYDMIWVKKDDQPSRVIQLNHLRLTQTDNGVYHMNQACHYYITLLPTYNHGNPQHMKCRIYLRIRGWM